MVLGQPTHKSRKTPSDHGLLANDETQQDDTTTWANPTKIAEKAPNPAVPGPHARERPMEEITNNLIGWPTNLEPVEIKVRGEKRRKDKEKFPLLKKVPPTCHFITDRKE